MTVFAESTPRGTGAISLIRMTGPETLNILRLITGMDNWSPHFQKTAAVKNLQGNPLDRVMAVFHPGPASYTGEDTAEISCHGNPLLVKSISEAISATGLAIPAQRGEFTMRAFRNGKMDVAQAEAVGAIIDAKNYCGIEMARGLMNGELSSGIASIKNDLEHIYADFEAAFIIDDTEPDIAGLISKVEEIEAALERYRSSCDRKGYAYSGIRTVIAGLPNAGKSSLFNAILGYDRVIVHEEEGTTRDVIKEHLEYDGLDFVFIDTAGLRDVDRGPEAAGIEMTKQAIKDSDMVLYVIDSVKGITDRDREWLSNGKITIAVFNKADLSGDTALPEDIFSIRVSAKYKTGMEGLFSMMREQFPRELPGLFIERHRILVEKAIDAIGSFKEGIFHVTPDAAVMDLKDAIGALKCILGEDVGQDVLDDIFSRFCVGK